MFGFIPLAFTAVSGLGGYLWGKWGGGTTATPNTAQVPLPGQATLDVNKLVYTLGGVWLAYVIGKKLIKELK